MPRANTTERWIVVDSGCWEWTGYVSPEGYGNANVNGGTARAHRWVYEQHRGPIPDGLVLDHLCRNRRCVNPDHLEPVTNRENVLRGDTLPARNLAKTHCDSGHEFTPENTGRTHDGRRMCMTCRREWGRKNNRERRDREYMDQLDGPVLAAPRDAAWYLQAHGRGKGAYALHCLSAGDPGVAACSRRTIVQTERGEPAHAVPEHARCKRLACQAAFRRADAAHDRLVAAREGRADG